jgi:2-polyprenyl-3-methyl-5-hydroxy-6-metoxy-1,4-benzoquinol methylase
MDLMHRMRRYAYRRFRTAKQFFIRRPPDFLSRLFFWLLGHAATLTSRRKLTKLDKVENGIWKAVYFQRFGTEPLFSLTTARPVAKDSADHVWPRGAKYDNSINRNFNLKLYSYFQNRADLRVMDLGCSGGGFVRSILTDGFGAVGLEGSDFSRKLRSGEWDTCPHHLFTCDITDDFRLRQSDGSAIQFHCVTAWEVLEHIPMDRIPKLIENIAAHLAPDGIFVASVDMMPDGNPVLGATYHLTLQPKAWWLEQFAVKGFREIALNPFNTRDYVRGNGIGLTDWDPADGEGFHLVLQKNPAAA